MGFLKSLDTKRQITALTDRDLRARQRAAERLGDAKDVKAVKPLIAVLDDRESSVRRAAAAALGKIGDDRAIEPLVGRLTDGSPAVRETAAKALGDIDLDWPRAKSARKGAHALIAALEGDALDVRRVAAMVLGKMGDGLAIGPLIRCLTDDSPILRNIAVGALNEIDPDWRMSQPAQKVLYDLILSLAHSDPTIREPAARALNEIGPDWPKSESK